MSQQSQQIGQKRGQIGQINKIKNETPLLQYQGMTSFYKSTPTYLAIYKVNILNYNTFYLYAFTNNHITITITIDYYKPT